jgi:RND family efflux transporter MFP subunit
MKTPLSGLAGLWLLTSLASIGAFAAPPPVAEYDALIEPYTTVELRSPVDGIIDSIAVDRGDVVQKDQELLKLHAEVEQAAYEVANAKAEFDKRKQTRARQLFADKAITPSDKEEADANARASELSARHAREMLNLRTLRSPISGVVVERYLAPGESVKDKTILKLVQLDPLRIEVVLPASMFGRVQKGANADIKPELAVVKPLSAKVTVVDKVIDGASGTFVARIEIPNPQHTIPSGLRCKVRFSAD